MFLQITAFSYDFFQRRIKYEYNRDYNYCNSQHEISNIFVFHFIFISKTFKKSKYKNLHTIQFIQISLSVQRSIILNPTFFFFKTSSRFWEFSRGIITTPLPSLFPFNSSTSPAYLFFPTLNPNNFLYKETLLLSGEMFSKDNKTYPLLFLISKVNLPYKIML